MGRHCYSRVTPALRSCYANTGVMEKLRVPRWFGPNAYRRSRPSGRDNARQLLTEATTTHYQIGTSRHVEMAEAMLGEVKAPDWKSGGLLVRRSASIQIRLGSAGTGHFPRVRRSSCCGTSMPQPAPGPAPYCLRDRGHLWQKISVFHIWLESFSEGRLTVVLGGGTGLASAGLDPEGAPVSYLETGICRPSRVGFGAPGRTRTSNQLLRRQPLCPLSYGGT